MKHTLTIIIILFLSIISFAQQCYNTNFNAGIAEYENANYEKAISYFKTAKLCPDRHGVSDANTWIGKCETGVKEQKKIYFYTYYDKAEGYYNNFEIDKAQSNYIEALNCNYDNIKAKNFSSVLPRTWCRI